MVLAGDCSYLHSPTGGYLGMARHDEDGSIRGSAAGQKISSFGGYAVDSD
jgi:hypothetical protein